ncbi:MAG: 4-hydroxybutyrate CoA-transferase [Syntrophomonadaceae bacterium]|nr:4-hydroxybutyrate CoA-transferase [Syntrophomonadaceae bacterium]
MLLECKNKPFSGGVQAEYQNKLVGVEEAVKHIRPHTQVVLSTGPAEPYGLIEALFRRRKDLQGVTIHHNLPMRPYSYLQEKTAPHIQVNAWFSSRHSRKGINEGWCDYTPNHFHELPYFLSEHIQPDVFLAAVSPMDEEGYFSFGTAVTYNYEVIEKARLVIVEENQHMPFTFGRTRIHISEVNYVVKNNCLLPEISFGKSSPEAEVIGGLVAEQIPDGATLQLGIGDIPNSVVKHLLSKKDLGIHAEMISDNIVELVEKGVVNNRYKPLNPGKVVASVALGTKKIYDFIHRNPMVELHPASYTNNPDVISHNPNLMAINATLEIDLFGQCASESIGYNYYSGTGGQVDFCRGAMHSRGGKSILVLPSTYNRGSGSRIVPCLKPGSIVSVTKNDTDYVVTEYGVAHLRGKSLRQRALALINIAHPDFRNELKREAQKMALI